MCCDPICICEFLDFIVPSLIVFIFRFANDHFVFIGGSPVPMLDTRKQKFAQHVQNWKTFAKRAFSIYNTVFVWLWYLFDELYNNDISCLCTPGLPVQVRDSVLEEHEKVTMATDRVNRGYQIDQLEKGFENGSAALPYGKIAASAILQRMARKQPYYKRNEAHVCSFYARGECTRGSSCPYR